jgi:hypothetical protein
MKMRITELKVGWCSRLGESGRGFCKNYINGMLIFDWGNAIELNFCFEYASVIWLLKCCK